MEKQQNRRFSRLIAITIASALSTFGLVFISAVPSNAQDGACNFAAGSGSSSSPYLVREVADLEMVRSCHGSASNLHFLMTTNLDLSGIANWTPIGLGVDDGPSFNDTFDGGDYTISNLVSSALDNTSYAGLFGYVGSDETQTLIRNLKLSGATVTQFRDSSPEPAAILIAESNRGTSVSNVEISDSNLIGSDEIGAVVGDGTSSHLTFTDIDIQDVTIKTPGFPAAFDQTVARVALFAGHLYENASISGVHVSNSNIFINSTSNVSKISGFHVGCDEEMIFIHSSATDVEIDITSGANASEISGFATGDSYIDDSCKYDDIESDTVISIDAAGYAGEIGGFGSVFEEALVSNSKSKTSLSILAGSHVREVGGVVGESKNNYTDFFNNNEFEADISVITTDDTPEENAAERIGLFFGEMTRSVVLDTLIHGSVEVSVPAGESVTGVSNFIGQLRDATSTRIRDFQNVIVNAKPLLVEIGEVSGSYSPDSYLVGDFDPGTPASFNGYSSGVYWNSSSAPGFSADLIGAPASLSNLNSQNYLEAAGYNFDRDWCMINGEARVASVNPGCIAGSGSEGQRTEPILPTLTVVTSGQRTFDSVGGLLQLEGDGLRGLGQVELANQSLFVQILSDTKAAVLIPAGLSAGTYDLELTGPRGTLKMQNAVTITGPSVNLEPGYWTQLQPDGTVKMYAKNIIGEGKVQFYQNGQEIAWIKATDALDPKLSGANGLYYLVRTRELVGGKNAFEIYLDGTRVWRAAYSKR